MASVRVDTAPLIAGAVVVSAYSGHGIRGADAPATGEHGPGLIGSAVSLPAENDDEFRALILTIPGALSGLVFGEDGTIEVPPGNPDGNYSGTYRLYKNGAAVAPDPQTYEINIGASGEITGDAALDGMAAGGGMDAPNALAGGATLDGPSASGEIQGGSTLTGGATFDGLSAGGGLDAPNSLSGGATMDSVSAAGEVQGGSSITGDAALDGLGAAGSMSSLSNSTLSGDASLDGLTASGGLDAPNALTGAATLDGMQAAGGAGSTPSDLSGAATLDDVSAAGGASSEPSDLSGDGALSSMSASGGASSPTSALMEELLTAVLRTVCPRVVPDVAPLGTVRPYITYQAIGGQAWRYVDLTAADKRHTMVQINVWADTRRQARNMIQSVEDALCAATTIVAWPMGEALSDSTELADRILYGSLQDFEVVAAR